MTKRSEHVFQCCSVTVIYLNSFDDDGGGGDYGAGAFDEDDYMHSPILL